jgi:hypothetical protein
MISYELSEPKFNMINKTAVFDARLGAFNDIKRKRFDDKISIPKAGDDIIFASTTRKNIGIFYTNFLAKKDIGLVKDITIAVFNYSDKKDVLDVHFIYQNFITKIDVDALIPSENDIVAIVYCIKFKDGKSTWISCDTKGTQYCHNDKVLRFVAQKDNF